MAQIKDFSKAKVYFENVPFWLRGGLGYLYKQGLSKAIADYKGCIIRCTVDWFTYWANIESLHNEYEEFMRASTQAYCEGYTDNPYLIKYRLDLDTGTIVGFCTELEGSEIWIDDALLY